VSSAAKKKREGTRPTSWLKGHRNYSINGCYQYNQHFEKELMSSM
jgi:hypothetical protein